MEKRRKRPHIQPEMHAVKIKKESYLKRLFKKIAAMEFSKIIFIFDASVALIVLVFSLAIMWKTENIDPLSTLITVVFGALAAGEGFYYNKAKAENKIKLMKENGIKPTEKTFIDDFFESEE